MYSFYFNYEGEAVQLPVPPSDLVLKVNNKNKVVELLNLGDVNLLKDPGLSEISFKALLPAQKYPFAVYPNGFKSVKYYLDRFERYKVNKKPVRFIVSRKALWGEPLFDTNMLVSLERYTIEESTKEGNDIVIALELKQYKEYKTQTFTIQPVKQDKVIFASAVVEPQRPAKEPAKTYTVKKGDTLWSICKKELNDGSKYKEIAKLNNISNPNLIYTGQVFRLS